MLPFPATPSFIRCMTVLVSPLPQTSSWQTIRLLVSVAMVLSSRLLSTLRQPGPPPLPAIVLSGSHRETLPLSITQVASRQPSTTIVGSYLRRRRHSGEPLPRFLEGCRQRTTT